MRSCASCRFDPTRSGMVQLLGSAGSEVACSWTVTVVGSGTVTVVSSWTDRGRRRQGGASPPHAAVASAEMHKTRAGRISRMEPPGSDSADRLLRGSCCCRSADHPTMAGPHTRAADTDSGSVFPTAYRSSALVWLAVTLLLAGCSAPSAPAAPEHAARGARHDTSADVHAIRACRDLVSRTSDQEHWVNRLGSRATADEVKATFVVDKIAVDLEVHQQVPRGPPRERPFHSRLICALKPPLHSPPTTT